MEYGPFTVVLTILYAMVVPIFVMYKVGRT